MSAEPDLAHDAILAAVREQYGLEVDRLRFLEDGTAHAYRAEGPGGRLFLKLLPDTPYGRDATRRIRAEVPLLRALRRGTLERVPQPVPTRDGADLASLGGFTIAAYEWIDAENLGHEWEGALPALAPLLGRLHAGTPELRRAVSALPNPPEDFALPFEAGWHADWQTLRDAGPSARQGVRAARELLLPYERALGRLLTQTRAFGEAARSAPPPFVVCHTDAHGGNVMRDGRGALWIIDWETARLAPPEHDLWMLLVAPGEVAGGNAAVLDAYAAGTGQAATLRPGVLAFYVGRRVLEDLAMDLDLLLHTSITPSQDAQHLRIMREYVLPALDRVWADLDRVRTLRH